jgi:hypothetical protein
MGRPGKTLVFVACFAAGITAASLLAGGGRAADSTPTETTTSVVTTAPVDSTQVATTVTVSTTETVERTTSSETVPTTTDASSGDGTPVWVWALLAILGVALAATIVVLARRNGHRPLSPEERGRRLDNAVSTWAAQGWAVESQTLDSAVLRRAGERMIVAVDASGQITTLPG